MFHQIKVGVILLIIFSSNVFSQTPQNQSYPTIKDMIYILNNVNAENADEFFAKKGFKFHSTREKEAVKNFRFYKDAPYKTISLNILKEKTFGISYETHSNSEYLRLKSTIKANDFIYVSSDTYNGKMILRYKKQNLSLNIWLALRNSKNVYYIDISDEDFINSNKIFEN